MAGRPVAGAAPAPGSTGARGFLRLIRHPGFGPYFAGNALSATGMWFYNLAAAILLFRLTGSELLLGVQAGCQFIPILVLSPWTGAAADRFDRRRVIVCGQMVAAALAAVVAVLAWDGTVSGEAVILLSAGIGTAQAFANPAAAALVVSLVEPPDLPSAVALNAMTYNLARAVGPALAAVAVTQIGVGAAFVIAAVAFLALATGVAVARARPMRRSVQSSARLRDTLALVYRQPRLAGYLVVVMLVGFASDPINTLAPAFAHAFDRPDTDAGMLIGVFGAGAVTAALVLTGRAPGVRSRIAGSLLMLGLGIAGFALTPWLVPALAMLFVAGFAYLTCNATATARLQLELDDAHRGRVMAVWGIAFLGLRPIASLIDGAVAASAGVRTAGVVLAVPAVAGALWVFLHHDGSRQSMPFSTRARKVRA
jgi:MFS family permease